MIEDRGEIKGFTLMELMVVVIIIGVIAAFAIPNYSKSVQKAHERDMLAQLTSIHASNLLYRSYAGKYWNTTGVSQGLAAINSGLKIVDAQTPIIDNTMRAKAFGKFVQGLSHAWLAVFFDKAFIFDETMDLTNPPLQYKTYNEVMVAAIKMLEDCIAICNSNTFTIPNTWINGVTLTNTELKRVAYSYLARFRAGVARTPAERAAVNWAKVISDAQSGVTADWGPVGDGNLWWAGL